MFGPEAARDADNWGRQRHRNPPPAQLFEARAIEQSPEGTGPERLEATRHVCDVPAVAQALNRESASVVKVNRVPLPARARKLPMSLAFVLIALGGLVYGVVEDSAAVGPLTAAAVVIGVRIYSDVGKRATN